MHRPGRQAAQLAERALDDLGRIASASVCPDHFVIGAKQRELIDLLMCELAARADADCCR